MKTQTPQQIRPRPQLDIKSVRSFFPALNTPPTSEWILMDNAGGSQICSQSLQKLHEYLVSSNVQWGGSYDISQQSQKRCEEGIRAAAALVNAHCMEEIVIGPSTTQLLYNLSHALLSAFKPGDELIVTDVDHEANIGCWLKLAKQRSMEVKWWRVNKLSLELDLKDLQKLLTRKTRLVCFTHCSNILGGIMDVKEIVSLIRSVSPKAHVCVDGVSYAPHRAIDVQELDVDYYALSFYKVYGPHCALLYVRKSRMDELDSINHFFIGKEKCPLKLEPGNVPFESTASLVGVVAYLNEIAALSNNSSVASPRAGIVQANGYEVISYHEEELVKALFDYLLTQQQIRLIGRPIFDRRLRVPTVSFVVQGRNSAEVAKQLDKHKIGIKAGHFYAKRLINTLGLAEQGGVIRISMVHYNTLEEVELLIKHLDSILKSPPPTIVAKL